MRNDSRKMGACVMWLFACSAQTPSSECANEQKSMVEFCNAQCDESHQVCKDAISYVSADRCIGYEGDCEEPCKKGAAGMEACRACMQKSTSACETVADISQEYCEGGRLTCRSRCESLRR